MLTLMFSFGNAENSKSKMQSDCERMAVKLCSVRDYLQHRRIQTIPLVRLSLSYREKEMSRGQEGSGSGTGLTLIAPPDPSKSKESKSASKDPSQDVSLLQKFKNMIELKREPFEVEKRRKAARAMSSAGNNGRPEGGQLTTIQSPFDLLRTAHASVPPIFLEVVLSRCARKYEQSKKWCHQGILWRSRGFWFCGEERVICDI